jgi:IS30 family transposase
MYAHITGEQRTGLGVLLRSGVSQAEVARQIGVHPSTVSRELRRNSNEFGSYHAAHARVLAREKRRRSKQAARKIEKDVGLAARIESLLHPLRSPECVAHDVGVVHETIYAWISRSRPDLKDQLPQRGRKRHRYGSKREKKQGWTRHVRSIDERPEASVSWEGDTVKGCTKAQLLTHVERTSLYAVVTLIPAGTADVVHAALKKETQLHDSVHTYDRGSEFALWVMIEKDTDSRVFFAHAHHPWERGKNENTNGRLRRVFPKKFDFSTIKQADVDAVVTLMNHTPRKSLGWRTPCSVFGKCCTSN